MSTNDDNETSAPTGHSQASSMDEADHAPHPEPEIDLTRCPRRAPDVAEVSVGDHLILLHPGTARALVIDPVSAALWQSFDGTTSLQVLVDDVVECLGFDVEAATANVSELERGFDAGGYLRHPTGDVVRRARSYPPIAPDT